MTVDAELITQRLAVWVEPPAKNTFLAYPWAVPDDNKIACSIGGDRCLFLVAGGGGVDLKFTADRTCVRAKAPAENLV
ncbi:MAG: hypothetical protein ACYS19_10070 [Planctomycetota bacterium]|jgi:hypothetical protein